MKRIQSKSLLTLIIIFFIIGFSTSAKDIIGFNADNFSDSTVDSISTHIHIESTLVKNPHWVAYPENLAAHREESKEFVKNYSKKQRSYIIYMFNRGKKFFPRLLHILDTYDVPHVFQMLPALESNFTANAVSKVGAVGYWQFMSELAGEYGLHTSSKNDERKNFGKSTIAAAKFFRDQLDFFNNDILLTVAAFNCGQGRVLSALKKSEKNDADFWDIKKYLPTETRIFVMKFIALNVISANYDKFINHKLNFNEPPLIQLAMTDSAKQDNTASRDPL
jgi:membrane-bound lytic murein transglycosylase D